MANYAEILPPPLDDELVAKPSSHAGGGKSLFCAAMLALILCPPAAWGAPAHSIVAGESLPDLSPGNEVQTALLEKSRTANDYLYASLKSFVCQEDIQRFEGNLGGSKPHPIDRVSAHLSFENGVEHYSDIRQDTRSLTSISALAGAWSEGEFGTLLQQTAQLLETQSPFFVANATLDGTPISIYRFTVTEQQSPWDLAVELRHYRIPFTTDVWILASSGEILKIARKSNGMPEETRISEIDWDVTLAAVDLNGKTWRLPIAAAYSVSYTESKHREWNQITFSGYRRYSSESALKFEGF
jgi:hypothetical protein